MLAIVLLTIRNWVGWISLHKRLVLALVGIVALLIALLVARGCYVDYKQGQVTKDLNNANKVINNGKDNSTVLEGEKGKREQDAVNAGIIANQAQENVNKVIANKETNVSVDIANRNRCVAYPEHCK